MRIVTLKLTIGILLSLLGATCAQDAVAWHESGPDLISALIQAEVKDDTRSSTLPNFPTPGGASPNELELESALNSHADARDTLEGDDLWTVTGRPTCFKCLADLGGIGSVEKALGRGSVESGDSRQKQLKKLCEAGTNDAAHQCNVDGQRGRCNKDFKHLTCNADDSFNFKLLTTDCEVVSLVRQKQRHEIKIYKKSSDMLKGYKGQTMRYSWKFRPAEDMALSHRFTHLFQLKFVGGDTQKPAATLTAVTPKGGGESVLQLRNTSHSVDENGQRMHEHVLREIPWSDVAGRWVSVTMDVTMKPMGSGGSMSVTITRDEDGASLLSINQTPVGMWRPGNLYNRPKWGIYRAFTDELNLNDASVDFTDICIERLEV